MALPADTDFFDPDKVTELISASLLADVHRMVNAARAGAAVSVDAALTLLYWQIGRHVREDVRRGERTGNSQQTAPALAHALTA